MRDTLFNIREFWANTEIARMLDHYDHQLLINHPRLWVIRLPYLVAYALITNMVMILLVLILPLQLHHVQEFFIILWLVFISTIVFLYLWNRQFRKYSPEKSYENTTPFNGLNDYFLYLACILIMISPTISTSLALYYRFDNMITLEELLLDASQINPFGSLKSYPNELVIKYTGNTAVQLYELNDYQIRASVRQSISYLKGIKSGDFNELQDFSYMYILVIHFGLLLFSGKQISKRVFNRSLLYGVIAIIVYTIYAMFISFLEYSSTIFGRIIGSIDTEIIVWPGPLIIFILFMLIMSLSVFYSNEKSDFAIMNVFLLPVGVYIYLFYWVAENSYQTEWMRNLENSDAFWFAYIVTSPLLYFWLIPLLKAMYMRNLALPEK